jgi:16S rRNA (guanine(1405)-N(7))-methyltransferase
MDDLERAVQTVRASGKYRQVCPEVVRNIAARELDKGRRWKEAVKATKTKLHQVGGAYLGSRLAYSRWLENLRAAASAGDVEGLRRACKEVMGKHSSTAERLEIVDHFYGRTLGGLPSIRCVLDVACGLNPLAIPWMPLGKDTAYYAFDIYEDMVAFLNEFFGIVKVKGGAFAQDIVQAAPKRKADLALILKSLPCIEQLERGASQRLLDMLNVQYLLVSYPVRSLGGREKGMSENYEQSFWELVEGRSWSVERFEFSSELAFLVHK